MALIKTARQVMHYARNPPELVTKIWAELTALDSRVTNAEAGVVAPGSISADELAMFVSTEQTGNGSAQNVAHGLGTTPTTVLVVPSLNKDGADCSWAFTKGSTNVVVTATSGAKYFVLAIK